MATTKKAMTERQERQDGAPESNTSSQSQDRTNGNTFSGTRPNNMNDQGGLSALAKGLGWFSIGLGLAELLAPRGVAKVAGLPKGNTTTLRLFGAREIASGIGIFMQQKPAVSLWSRVAGDGLDLACLGAAFASPEAKKGRLAFATASVLGVTALDVLAAQQLSSNGAQSGIHVHRSLVINRSREDVYDFWRKFENLPRFMKHVQSVTVQDQKRSRWVITAPAGTTVEWDAEITEDRPNHLISWRSLEGADVDNYGSVNFINAPGNRGTIIHVQLRYSPPGGVLGATVAKFFGEEPQQQLSADLRRLKQLLETGEVVLSDATVRGTGYMEQQPAQPPVDTTEVFQQNVLDL